MSKKEIPKEIIIAAIGVIGILAGIAMLKGVNGTYFTIAIGAIMGLAGLVLPQLKTK